MANQNTISRKSDLSGQEYQWGFVTDIETDLALRGLSEDIVRLISSKKGEPEWMLEWRLKAYRHWVKLNDAADEPEWAKVKYPKIDYQDIYYYAAPKSTTDAPKSLDDVDPEMLATFEKLGIPLQERAKLAGVAVDAVFDSVSVATTFEKQLGELGIIFCSFSEAVKNYPDLVKKYLGSVVPHTDNFFASLNAAVFSDGSFAYIPPGVRCPIELMTYFRINTADTGQFERTLIIADEGSRVHYIEGCTAPTYAADSLHSAVVELFALPGSHLRYTTIQNWSKNVYNLVTKRAVAHENATVEWVDGNLGSKLTMKFPCVYLVGEKAHAEILSIAFAGDGQHQDAGAKIYHAAPDTTSRITSKSISKDGGRASYRGMVKVYPDAVGSKVHVECDALLMGENSRSDTYPTMEIAEEQVQVEHEARVSKVGDEQLFYLMSRGLTEEEALVMVVNGFVEPFVKELPMEYAVEFNRLIQLEMEGSVG